MGGDKKELDGLDFGFGNILGVWTLLSCLFYWTRIPGRVEIRILSLGFTAWKMENGKWDY